MKYRIRVDHPKYAPSAVLWQRPGLMGLSPEEPFSIGEVQLATSPNTKAHAAASAR
jgi:hypothetical protein